MKQIHLTVCGHSICGDNNNISYFGSQLQQTSVSIASLKSQKEYCFEKIF